MKTRSHCGTVVDCRTRDPDVPSSNPGVDKKKISHRSNQNNTTTNPSAPELNTWNCQTWKPKVTVWQFQVFISDAEGLVVVLFWLDLWEILSLATPGFEHGTSGSLVLHSTTMPWWLLVFNSKNFRYLTLVQRDWWWYCSDWTYERFSLWPPKGLNWGPLDL